MTDSIYSLDRRLELSKGAIPQLSNDLILGENLEITTGTDPEDVWNQGGTYTYLTAATTLYLSSSNNGDTEPITVYGLDANWDPQVITTTLTGQTQVAAGTWLRINRIVNSSMNLATGQGTDLLGDVYLAETDTLTGGVPDTASKIKAKIDIGNNVSLMTLYSAPRFHNVYVAQGFATLRGATNGDATFKFMVRQFGGVFMTGQALSVSSAGNNTFRYPFALNKKIPGKSDLKLVCDSVSRTSAVTGGFEIILEYVGNPRG